MTMRELVRGIRPGASAARVAKLRIAGMSEKLGETPREARKSRTNRTAPRHRLVLWPGVRGHGRRPAASAEAVQGPRVS